MDNLRFSLQSFSYLSDDDRSAVGKNLQLVISKLGKEWRVSKDYIERGLDIISEWNLPIEPILLFLAYHLSMNDLSNHIIKNELNLDNQILQQLQLLIKLNKVKRLADSESNRKAFYVNKTRQLFYLASTDLDLALLALALHVLQMEVIETYGPTKARLLCEESNVVFMPLLELLGMWELHRNLGDQCLEVLNPKHAWEKISKEKKAIKNNLEKEHKNIHKILRQEFNRAGLDPEISPHISSNATIYGYVQRGWSFSQILKKIKFKIKLNTDDECYRALGVIHAQWPPIRGKSPAGSYFRDLIAAPKFNGFRSLITTVRTDSLMWDQKILIEFQLYTPRMENINSRGVISARYQSQIPQDVKNSWWSDPKMLEFIHQRPLNSNSKKIYVFSPNGKVYWPLPEKSVPIDYAYRIHSELGNHCTRIWVNGKSGKYNHSLRNGDLVEVQVDQLSPGPDIGWMDVVKTSTAKRSIKAALSKKSPHRGRQIIEKILKDELRLYRLSSVISANDVEEYLKRAAKYHGYLNTRAMYLDIAKPEIKTNQRVLSPNLLVSRFISIKLAENVVRDDGKPLGVPITKVRFSQCRHSDCPKRLYPGTEIVGRMENADKPYIKMIVYEKNCPNAIKIRQSIPLKWATGHRPGEPIRIFIQAVDRLHLLQDVLKHVYSYCNQGLILLGVEANVDKERRAFIQLTIDTSNSDLVYELENGFKEMKKIGGIDDYELEYLPILDRILPTLTEFPANPYTPTAVDDPRVFKGRDVEIRRVTEALNDGHKAIVIYGISRVGKTSLLRFLSKRFLPRINFLPVLVNLQGLSEHNEEGFWFEMARKISQKLDDVGLLQKGHKVIGKDRNKIVTFENICAWIEKVTEGLYSDRLVILLDEINVLEDMWENRNMAVRVTAQLKALVESKLKIHFIFSVQEVFYKYFAITNNSYLLNTLLRLAIPIQLDHLDRAAAESLIRDPMGKVIKYQTELVNNLIDVTASHPFYLQTLLLNLISKSRDDDCYELSSSELDTVLAEVILGGGSLFAQFLNEDSVFHRDVLSVLASDEKHLGKWYSIQEVSQVLSNRGYRIYERGLIESLEKQRSWGALEQRIGSDGKLLYAIRVPLYQLWLHKKFPVELIKPK
jgi:GTP diphosphokinase / guanosine-3',5'-bis(diphosphate) 3'-diphosphatase